MKPVVVGIRDGLGNQLFQFASGYALAKRLGVPLDLDISWYSSNVDATPRQFRIGDLIPRHAYRNIYKNYGLARLQTDRFIRLGHLSRARAFRFGVPIYNVKPTDELPISGIDESVFIQGWPFDFRDLEDVLCEVRKLVWKKTSKLGRFRNQTDFYSFIHIRRGDYSGSAIYSDRYSLLSREYFDHAIRVYEEEFGRTRWIVCSDSPKEAIQLLPQSIDFESSNATSDLDDFAIMMEAKGGILSNSTFSLWAALLNEDKSSRFIAPILWRKDGTAGVPTPSCWRRI